LLIAKCQLPIVDFHAVSSPLNVIGQLEIGNQ